MDDVYIDPDREDGILDQTIGFVACREGLSIADLYERMVVAPDEWRYIKKDALLFLNAEDIKEIEERILNDE